MSDRATRDWEHYSENVEAILTDLIAELVGDDGDGHELTGAVEDGCQVCAAIDRAEARLRKVTDE